MGDFFVLAKFAQFATSYSASVYFYVLGNKGQKKWGTSVGFSLLARHSGQALEPLGSPRTTLGARDSLTKSAGVPTDFLLLGSTRQPLGIEK